MVPIVTVFYSNESGNSKALLQQINNFNLMDQLSIKFINIDNSEMKNLVIKKFLVVPSIVVLQQDEVSLYTGENVFEWFNAFESSVMEENSSEDEFEQVEDQIQPSILNNKNNEESEPPTKKTIMEIAAELSKARDNDKL